MSLSVLAVVLTVRRPYCRPMGSATQEVNAQKSVCSPISQAVSLSRQGNPQGFDILYREYSKLVRAACLRILRNSTEAEDTAQDVFIQVLRKVHTFRGDSSLATWLYRVATNAALMRIRRTKHDRMTSAQSKDDDAPGRKPAAQDFSLPMFPYRIDLKAAVNSLPAGYKQVFILHDVEGYHHKEISGILGSSIGNSKSQLHRARKRLRDFLGDSAPEPIAKSHSKKRCQGDGLRSINVDASEWYRVVNKRNSVTPKLCETHRDVRTNPERGRTDGLSSNSQKNFIRV